MSPGRPRAGWGFSRSVLPGSWWSHSAPTLALLHQTLRGAHDALSAAETAERTGVSRATAQRYLSYLVKEGMVRLELRYGATGRPEDLYRITH
ncbi:helix-turn-helix domain-containing protein [Streptomyces sp. B21-097]|uniref:helix-turn-helix domain-containing protein n=1 Tax=Streptomyces sp. B21-097 TaxID=3039414 RepID=UPI003FA78A84